MPGEELIGKQVRCFAGYDHGFTVHTGKVVAYRDSPSYILENEAGHQITWLVSLTEEIAEEPLTEQMADALQSAKDYLEYALHNNEAPFTVAAIDNALRRYRNDQA